jgi:hypothetical protein
VPRLAPSAFQGVGLMRTCVLGGVVMALFGCGATTPEGCPIMMTEIGRARMEACIAAYNEEKARAAGGTVTRCTRVGGSLSCVTY